LLISKAFVPDSIFSMESWQSLTREIGVDPEDLLEASPANLGRALRLGGMVPELRAMRLKEIAARVKDEYAGDLRSALVGRVTQVRKLLKKFPNIADPGADRILLFGSIAPVAAIPSNCPHVLAIMAEVPEKFDTRSRAYLRLKRHGQALCKRTRPKCSECSVSASCAYFAGNRRGR
jgi:endonuclease III